MSHPICARGILLQPKEPLRWTYAGTTGAAFDWCRRSRVISVYGNSQSHNFMEKLSATPANVPWKRDLKYCITTSVAFIFVRGTLVTQALSLGGIGC